MATHNWLREDVYLHQPVGASPSAEVEIRGIFNYSEGGEDVGPGQPHAFLSRMWHLPSAWFPGGSGDRITNSEITVGSA